MKTRDAEVYRDVKIYREVASVWCDPSLLSEILQFSSLDKEIAR
jgi:hypothetical protein